MNIYNTIREVIDEKGYCTVKDIQCRIKNIDRRSVCNKIKRDIGVWDNIRYTTMECERGNGNHQIRLEYYNR